MWSRHSTPYWSTALSTNSWPQHPILHVEHHANLPQGVDVRSVLPSRRQFPPWHVGWRGMKKFFSPILLVVYVSDMPSQQFELVLYAFNGLQSEVTHTSAACQLSVILLA
jgi:hypothetical protein